MEKEKQKALFRCSSIGALMTKPRSKSETLSKTAKSYILKAFLKNEFGYYEEVVTDHMTKGHLCEAESRKMITNLFKDEFRTRYGNYISKGLIGGTPDIVLKLSDYCEDIKNSANLRTFMESELTKDYFGQGQGYLYLTGKRHYRLIYTLQPSPIKFIENEQRRLLWKFGGFEENEDYQRMCKQLEHNNELIHGMSMRQRIKIFEFEYDSNYIDDLLEVMEVGKEYYDSLFHCVGLEGDQLFIETD